MDVRDSPRVLELVDRVRACVDERVLPVEEPLLRERADAPAGPDWRARRVPPDLGRLKRGAAAIVRVGRRARPRDRVGAAGEVA